MNNNFHVEGCKLQAIVLAGTCARLWQWFLVEIRGGPEEGGGRESGWWLGLVTWNSRQLGAWSLEPRTWNQLACDSALSVRSGQRSARRGRRPDPTLVTGLLARLPRSGFQEHSALECVLSCCAAVWIFCSDLHSVQSGRLQWLSHQSGRAASRE